MTDRGCTVDVVQNGYARQVVTVSANPVSGYRIEPWRLRVRTEDVRERWRKEQTNLMKGEPVIIRIIDRETVS